MNWISVKDRLPETKPYKDWYVSEKVLVLVGDVAVTAHYEHGQFPGEESWVNWWDHWCQDLIQPGGITHWMPLPDLPKEDRS